MNGEWYVQWSIFYVRDECNCSTTQGWDYHQLWNLFSLSKILQGKRTKKTLDLIGWFFNGGSNPLGPLFGSRKTHGYPALLMDDILHRQRLDGKVSRMEHYIQVNVQNCIVEMMWTKIRNLQTRTPPGCLVTPLSICFGILKEGTGIHIYIYKYSILYVDFDANPLWKMLGQVFVQHEQSFTRHQTPLKSSKHLSVPFRSGRPFMVGEWETSLIWNHEINFLRSACLMGKNRKHIP